MVPPLFFVIIGCAGWIVGPSHKDQEIKYKEQHQTVFNLAGTHSPGSYYYYLVARILIADQALIEAEEFLEKAVSLETTSILLKQELALLYLQTNKKSRALVLCEEVLEIQPDNIEVQVIAGSISQAQGDVARAVQLYETVIEKAPDRKNIYIVLGRLYMEEGAFEAAEHVFETLINRYPASYAGYYYLGMAFAGSGKIDKAVEALDMAIQLEPGLVEARLELINIYGNMNETHKVIELHEDIVRDYPENISAAITLGLIYLENAFDVKANALFEELGVMAGVDRTVIDTVIEMVIAQKRYEQAVLMIEGMLEGLPEDPDLHYLAGISEYLEGRYDEALSHMHGVNSESRFYADAIIRKASIYNKQQDHDKAIAELHSALSDSDQFNRYERLRIIRFLGAIYLDVEKYQNAIDTLTQALEIDPEDLDVHYELGIAYDRSGDTHKTIEQMKILIEKEPEHAEALNYLGYTWADSGIRLDEAEDFIRRALEIKPDSGHILDSMGWVFFKKGEIEKAVLYLEKAVAKKPEDPVILEHLGDAYLGLNRKAEALELYRRALLAMETAINSDDRQILINKIESLKNN